MEKNYSVSESIEQVTDADFPLDDEELLGAATAPPTPETGGSMLAIDPVRASGEGRKEQRRLDLHSRQEPPVCIPPRLGLTKTECEFVRRFLRTVPMYTCLIVVPYIIVRISRGTSTS